MRAERTNFPRIGTTTYTVVIAEAYTYGYDGAGNVTKTGAAWNLYDKVSRLASATVYDGPTGAGTQKTQSYTFDPFGNMTAIGGTSARNTPTSPATNRLTGTGVVYDTRGNLTNWNGATYEYDEFNLMHHMTSGAEEWLYVYTADDERIWMKRIGYGLARWTLRDLGAKVLREYTQDTPGWLVSEDYLYRDGQLLAGETPTGRKHYHLDHLGTPRLITNSAGTTLAYHLYYPFGEEATAFNQDTERMKFTGHERDLASTAGAGDDLDYMHARHCSPVTGRFMSVDRVGGITKKPQSWNRYTYSRGNPMKYVDPTGLYVVVAASDRATVKHAYANSPTFRAQFDAANKNTNILVHLSSVARDSGKLKRGSTGGETTWVKSPIHVVQSDGTKTYKGIITSIVPIGADLAARFGHELAHSGELALRVSLALI